MQPRSQVSPDGKYWWDGRSWQALADRDDGPAPEGQAHWRQVAGAVLLWAMLLQGAGCLAFGTLVLAGVLTPRSPQAPPWFGIVLVALGWVVSAPEVIPAAWLLRSADPAARRPRARWVLWLWIALGIGTVALGAFVLAGSLVVAHPQNVTAPGVFLVGLGAIFCLGPALRLRGFSLLTKRHVRARRSERLPARPISWRVLLRLFGTFAVVELIAVIMAESRHSGFGAAIIAGLAFVVVVSVAGLVVLVPIGIVSARQQRTHSAELAPVLLPPPPTTIGSITVRMSPGYLWQLRIVFGAVGIFFLYGAYQGRVDGVGSTVIPAVMAVLVLAVGFLATQRYVHVDPSTITFGPSYTSWATRRSTFNRAEVALIRAIPRLTTPRILFLRADGSIVCRTDEVLWGRAGIQKLASYLGVPFDR